jgi:23S rRNA pseudouridine1911/1915/1917 synthase
MISKRLQIDEENANNRIDIFLSKSFDSISRGIVQDLIGEGKVLVNGKTVERDYKTKINDVIEIEFNLETNNEDQAQDISLDIIFENDDFLIIDKQAGLTVHPGAGQKDSTLINGLLNIHPKQRKIPRYGVVHRLDKDTSGLMIIARTLESHTNLTDLIQKRNIKRNYYALVHGQPIAGDTIDKPIGRHPKNRLLFCVKDGGRQAITHFKIYKKFKNFSLLDVSLETGRTHQIRVHMQHIGHPIAGDQSYCKIKNWKNSTEKEVNALSNLKRQSLHAYKLEFIYEDENFSFLSDIPDELQRVIDKL